jgi:hypothetical protein
VWYGVFDHDQSVFVEASYGFLQIARGETTVGCFMLGWLDGCWISRSEAMTRSRSQSERRGLESAKESRRHCGVSGRCILGLFGDDRIYRVSHALFCDILVSTAGYESVKYRHIIRPLADAVGRS